MTFFKFHFAQNILFTVSKNKVQRIRIYNTYVCVCVCVYYVELWLNLDWFPLYKSKINIYIYINRYFFPVHLKLLFATVKLLLILFFFSSIHPRIFYMAYFLRSQYFQRTNRLADVNRRLKSQIWSSVVTIVLVEAKNLLPMDIEGLSDPYVKFR